MALFKKKDDGYVDLTEKMRKRQAQAESFKSHEPEVEETPVQESSSGSGNGFFGGFFGGGSAASTSVETSTESSDEKKRRLAKRLGDMTNKIEDLEKEVYQLKQKLEVLEKKQRLGY